MPEPLLIAVMGPTASGKSDLAEALAERLDARLMNADAFQAYRGLDVGTAKPTAKERYDLLDVKNPDEDYGVGEFVTLAHPILQDLFVQQKSAVVVGGTGLYLRALFEQYAEMLRPPSPELRGVLRSRLEAEGLPALVTELDRLAPGVEIDRRNPVRVLRALERLLDPAPPVRFELPPFRRLKLAVVPPKALSDERITQRAQWMVQNDWVREVKSLRESGYVREHPGFRAIGYRQMWDHLDGRLDLAEAVATTIAETKRYAKRQRTWLRSEPNLLVYGYDAPRPDPLEWAWELVEAILV